MIRVLFVCLGNICRSPLAEAVFNKMLAEQGLQDRIASDSAGTGDYHIGAPPDERSVAVAQKHKVPITHQARQFSATDFRDFDYILAMDHHNLNHIRILEQRQRGNQYQLFLIREFEQKPDSLDVPDPYWSEADGFEQVYRMLNQACAGLLTHIKAEHKL